MSEQEYSEDGTPIYRYKNRDPKEFDLAAGDPDNIEAIEKHIEEHIGAPDIVFHEIVSDIVHVDVHWVKPREDFPFHALVTSGMSDKPMNAPEGAEAFKYAELCIFLPAGWKLGETEFEDENNYWPVRWLKKLARFPHEYNTWLGDGHTIPNGEAADPFAPNTKLGCMILLRALSTPDDFDQLKINEEKTINFYCLYPLYKEEMDFKLKKGRDALIDKFREIQVTDVVDIERPNTCRKKGLFGLW